MKTVELTTSDKLTGKLYQALLDIDWDFLHQYTDVNVRCSEF